MPMRAPTRTTVSLPGKAEQAVIWREGPTWCRALVDWLPGDPRAPLLDLKRQAKVRRPMRGRESGRRIRRAGGLLRSRRRGRAGACP